MSGERKEFPEISGPTIKEALDEFYAEQEKRLAPSTLDRYSGLLAFLMTFLDRYGEGYLNGPELTMYQREGRSFCQLFGPEKIPLFLPEFLGRFLLHRVLYAGNLIRGAGAVTKKLGAWLKDRGYISPQEAEEMLTVGKRASKELPMAEKFGHKVFEHTSVIPYPEGMERLEELFWVEKVEKGRLFLTAGTRKVTLELPEELTELCRPGWLAHFCLIRTPSGWRVVDGGWVDPLL